VEPKANPRKAPGELKRRPGHPKRTPRAAQGSPKGAQGKAKRPRGDQKKPRGPQEAPMGDPKEPKGTRQEFKGAGPPVHNKRHGDGKAEGKWIVFSPKDWQQIPQNVTTPKNIWILSIVQWF